MSMSLAVRAETMTSENYSVESGRIGTDEISIPFSESETYSIQATPTGEQSTVATETKKIDVRLKKEVIVGAGFVAKVKQEIDEIEITGSYDENHISYDLDDLGKQEKQNVIRIRIEDLDLPDGVNVISHGDRETVAKVTVSKSESFLTTFFRDLFGGGDDEDAGESGLPGQLFDISLEIDEATISNIQELVARVIFTSFGAQPTPIDLTFVILDEARSEVYRDEGSDVDVVVETEAVFNKSFENAPDLPLGNYTLVVTTLYNTDVKDEFRADFEIKKPTIKNLLRTWWFWLIIVLIIVILILLWLWWRRKEEEDEKEKRSEPGTKQIE